jgi:hypothetical protein
MKLSVAFWSAVVWVMIRARIYKPYHVFLDMVLDKWAWAGESKT